MIPGLGAKGLAAFRTRTRCTVGHCLIECRTPLGVRSKYGSAILAWKNARDRHSGDMTPPAGALFFFEGGRYGHVTMGTNGRGGIRSTDWPSPGVISETTVHKLAAAWGYKPLGWAENVNDQLAWRRPEVDASDVARAVRSSGSVQHGAWIKKALAHEVGRGLMNVKDDNMGFRSKRRFKRWQKKIGSTVSGIPSARDLALLGDRDADHLFEVKG